MGLSIGVCTSCVNRASTPVVFPVAVKLNVLTKLLAVRLVQLMSAGTPAAALQRGDSRVQGSDGTGVRLLLRLHGEGRVGCIGLALGVVPSVALGLAVGVAEQPPAWCR